MFNFLARKVRLIRTIEGIRVDFVPREYITPKLAAEILKWYTMTRFWNGGRFDNAKLEDIIKQLPSEHLPHFEFYRYSYDKHGDGYIRHNLKETKVT